MVTPTSTSSSSSSEETEHVVCDLCQQAPATRECSAKKCAVRVCAACTHGAAPFLCSVHGGPGPSDKGKTPLAKLVKDLQDHGFVVKKEVSLQSPAGKAPAAGAQFLGTVELDPQTMVALFATHPEMETKAARELERYKTEVLGKQALQKEVDELEAALKAKKKALAALAARKRSRVEDGNGAEVTPSLPGAAKKPKAGKQNLAARNPGADEDDYAFGDAEEEEEDDEYAVQGMRALSTKAKATPRSGALRIGPSKAGAARGREEDGEDADSDETPPPPAAAKRTSVKPVAVPPPLPLTEEQKAAFKYTTRVLSKEKVFAAVTRQMEATGTVVMTALLEDLKLPAGAGKPLRAWYAGVADEPLPSNPPGRPPKANK